MSADNGVYILKTSDGQYRVETFQAVDNLYYNVLHPDYDDLCSLEVFMQYENTKYTKNYAQAMTIAGDILQKLFVCEYGIQIIDTKKTWATICEEARKEAKEVLAEGINNYFSRDKLEKIAQGGK